ncbi:hypothetical protein FZC70_16370 [Bacillus subtilis]|nr:hypothetical protein FZC70_16370 [Bacillus subtilis]
MGIPFINFKPDIRGRNRLLHPQLIPPFKLPEICHILSYLLEKEERKKTAIVKFRLTATKKRRFFKTRAFN